MDYIDRHDHQLLEHLQRHGPTMIRCYRDEREARRLEHRGLVRRYTRNGKRIVALRGVS